MFLNRLLAATALTVFAGSSACRTNVSDLDMMISSSSYAVKGAYLRYTAETYAPPLALLRSSCVVEVGLGRVPGDPAMAETWYARLDPLRDRNSCVDQLKRLPGIHDLRVVNADHIEMLPLANGLIGGSDAAAGQFPATVGLIVDLAAEDNPDYLTCTMTKVGVRHFLLAAHCLVSDDGERAVHERLRAGRKIRLLTGPENSPEAIAGAMVAEIKAVHIHPSWADPMQPIGIDSSAGQDEAIALDADIAVLETVEDNLPNVPVSAVARTSIAGGTSVVLNGYGCRGYHSMRTRNLAFANESITAVRGSALLIKKTQADSAVLTGICPGDSGGGLFLASDAGMLTVVGVNSRFYSDSLLGSPPTEAYSYFSRLDDSGPHHVGSWLQDVLGEAPGQ